MGIHFQELGINFIDDPGSTTTTMGFGRRLVLQHAIEACHPLANPVFFWREPEKNMAKFMGDILAPILTGKAQIVIPRRRSLESYPSWAQPWEMLIGIYASKLIGTDADYCVGPRAFTLEVAERYFLRYPGDCPNMPDAHDCIFNPLVAAGRDGVKIASVTIDFQYPEAQRDAEENDAKTIDKRTLVVLPQLCGAMRAYANWLSR